VHSRVLLSCLFEEKSENSISNMNGIASGLVLILFLGAASALLNLQERYNWRQLDWVFPNQATRDRAIASGDYIPTNGLPVGIERWQNKLFVTVPRWRNGQ
jgi:hypothetical protein